MPNRGEDERNIRSLMFSTAGSFLVSLPLEHVQALKWKPKQKLVVTKTRDGLVIKEWKK